MKKSILAGAAALALLVSAAPAEAVNGTQAETIARYHAANQCPRPGASAWYRCLDTDLSRLTGTGGGTWSGTIMVWECLKVSPLCRSRQSAGRFGEQNFRISAGGTATAAGGFF